MEAPYLPRPMRTLAKVAWLLALSSMLLAAPASAESSTAHRLTVREATEHALARRPSAILATAREELQAARGDAADADGLPRVTLVAQANRSTGNVVPGSTFALAGLPGVQGPPGASRFGAGEFQTVAGVTASWDVMELVRRPALAAVPGAELRVARAQSALARLVIVTQVADAYLLVAEARALRTAAAASLARTEVFRATVAALVEQRLRPEMDLARAESELATARVLVERTKLGVATTSARLAEALGETAWDIDIVEDDFASLPALPAASFASVRLAAHPAVAAQSEGAHTAEARARVARLGYLPRVDLLGAAWLRGGGYVLGGPNSGDAAGLLPDTPNWALGLAASWTPTEIGPATARAHAEQAEAKLAMARAGEVEESLGAELRSAHAALESSLAVSRETAVALRASRRTLELAAARYTSGLGTVVEIADAERALATAERDAAVARLEAWRAVVALCRAAGTTTPIFARPLEEH